jgi:hypothetical protein
LLAGSLALAGGVGVAMARSGALHAAGAKLYWSNGRNYGKIFDTNPDGANARTIASGQRSPDGLAVGGGHLYWVNLGGSKNGYSGKGKIIEAALNGAHAKTIATLRYNWDYSHGYPISVSVAIGNGHLYWASLGRYGNAGGIYEANRDGTQAKKIATGQQEPLGVAAGGGHVYWGLGGGISVTSGGSSSWGPGNIVEANSNGTDAKTIGSVQGFPTSIGVGGGHLYWADGNTIVEANLDGSDPKTIVSKVSSGVMAVGAGHLYWSAGLKIVEANLDGTGAKTIVTHHGVAGIAVGS